MNTFQEKTNNYIAQITEPTQTWLREERKKSEISKNKYLIGQIDEAEKSLKEIQGTTITEFKRFIKRNNKQRRKNKDPLKTSFFDEEEKRAKHQFEKHMKSIDETWKEFNREDKEQAKKKMK